MKMRATIAGGNTDVRVLMTHPMTTAQSGQRCTSSRTWW